MTIEAYHVPGRIFVETWALGGSPLLDNGVFDQVLSCEVRHRIDKLGDFDLVVPANHEKSFIFQHGREVWFRQEGFPIPNEYSASTGTPYIFGGIIESIQREDSVNGPRLHISGPQHGGIWRYATTHLGRQFNGATVTAVMANLDDDVVGYGWTVDVDAAIASKTITIRFDGISLWEAVLKVAQLVDAHVRINFSNKTLYIGNFGATSGLKLTNRPPESNIDPGAPEIGYIERIQIAEDSSQVINTVQAVGQGSGVNVFTMENTTRPLQILTNTSFETNTADWGSFQGTLSRTSAHFRHGAWSLRVTYASGGFSALQQKSLSGATAGRIFSTSAYIWAEGSVVGKTFTAEIFELGGAGGSAATTSPVTLNAGWNFVRHQHTIVNNDRTTIQVEFRLGSGTSGEFFDLDAAVLQEAVLADLDFHPQWTGMNSDGITPLLYIEDSPSQGTYGVRWANLPFKDIGALANSPTGKENAANALYDLARTYLKRHRYHKKQYTVPAIIPRHDIVDVGEMVRVDYVGAVDQIGFGGTSASIYLDVDENLMVLEKAIRYGAGQGADVKLTLTDREDWLAEDADIVIGRLESLEGMQVGVQLYTFMQDHGMERESVESAGSFWFDYQMRFTNTTHLVHAVWLDFKIRGLKSNAKTGASGGAHSSTSVATAGGSVTQVSDFQHYHRWAFWRQNADLWTTTRAYDSYVENAAPASSSEGFEMQSENTNHLHTSHDFTSGSNPANVADDLHVHGFSVPDHTHPLTYGIFVDSLPSPATTQVYINGVLFNSYTSDQNQLDITSAFVNATTGEPLRQEHIIQFRTSASKAYDIVAHAYSLVSASAIGAVS